MSILLQIIFPFWLLLHNIEQFPALYFPCGSAGKESTCNEGDLGSIPGLGSSPGERKSYPLQYSGLENSMDCIVHRVTKSQTQLSFLKTKVGKESKAFIYILSCSVAQLCLTLWHPRHQTTLSFTVSWSLLKHPWR